MRGSALVLVLFLLAAIALLVLAEAGWGIAERRSRTHLLREQLLDEALQYALALAESRLRERLRAAAPLGPGEIFSTGEMDEMAFVEVTYPPADFGSCGNRREFAERTPPMTLSRR